MYRLTRSSKTNTTNSNPARIGNTNIAIVFGGTFAGVVFGVLLSVGFMKPMLQSAVASATKDLSQKVAVAAVPAANFTECTTPTITSGGQALGASTSLMPSSSNPSAPGGKGGGGSSGGTKTVFVHKLISGVFATTTASNNNTGPDSTNTIVTKNTNTTTVTNNNDISVNNSNDQSATSGDASSTQNTTAGNTASGSASNTNKSDLNIAVTN
jgi:hypothetical protein